MALRAAAAAGPYHVPASPPLKVHNHFAASSHSPTSVAEFEDEVLPITCPPAPAVSNIILAYNVKASRVKLATNVDLTTQTILMNGRYLFFDQLKTVSTFHQLPPAQICIPPPAERTTTIQPDDPPALICTPLPAERATTIRPSDI